MFVKLTRIQSRGGSRDICNHALEELLLSHGRAHTLDLIMPSILYWSKTRDVIAMEKGQVKSSDAARALCEQRPFIEPIITLANHLGAPYLVKVDAAQEAHRWDISYFIGTKEYTHSNPTRERGLNYHYPTCCTDALLHATATHLGSLANHFKFNYAKLPPEKKSALSEAAYILHKPCSFPCEETWRQARVYQAITRAHFPRIARLIESTHLAEYGAKPL